MHLPFGPLPNDTVPGDLSASMPFVLGTASLSNKLGYARQAAREVAGLLVNGDARQHFAGATLAKPKSGLQHAHLEADRHRVVGAGIFKFPAGYRWFDQRRTTCGCGA